MAKYYGTEVQTGKTNKQTNKQANRKERKKDKKNKKENKTWKKYHHINTQIINFGWN